MKCLIVDDDELVRKTLAELIEETDFLSLVKSCSTAIEAGNALKKGKIDLIFLDVKLPKLSGLDFVKTLVEEDKPLIIMVSGDKGSAADAYDLDVCDFILKPITRARFLKAVTKAQKIAKNTITAAVISDAFFVKSNSALVRVNIKDVYMVEALADYVTIYAANQKYVLKSTMKNIVSRLPQSEFIRVHNSYIVRIDRITSIEDTNMVVNKQIIPISRSKRKYLMDTLNFL
jgi:two-component system LytT family response regulator